MAASERGLMSDERPWTGPFSPHIGRRTMHFLSSFFVVVVVLEKELSMLNGEIVLSSVTKLSTHFISSSGNAVVSSYLKAFGWGGGGRECAVFLLMIRIFILSLTFHFFSTELR